MRNCAQWEHQRQNRTILRSDYIYCIYFHLFLLYNLKFLEYSFCEWKWTRMKSRLCQCPSGWKIRHICQGGSNFAGGRILLFSMEYVKYRKVTKCRFVIKLLIDQNRPPAIFWHFSRGSWSLLQGVLNPQPLIIYVHVCFRYYAWTVSVCFAMPVNMLSAELVSFSMSVSMSVTVSTTLSVAV